MTNPIKKLLKSLLVDKPTNAKPEPNNLQKPIGTEIPKVELAYEDWVNYANGLTIGTKGSEDGLIVVDLESLRGARITLEQGIGFAPFAVTLGIYSLMFHTHFCSSLDEGISYIKDSINKIESVFLLYDTLESERGDWWHDKHDQLMKELIQ